MAQLPANIRISHKMRGTSRRVQLNLVSLRILGGFFEMAQFQFSPSSSSGFPLPSRLGQKIKEMFLGYFFRLAERPRNITFSQNIFSFLQAHCAWFAGL